MVPDHLSATARAWVQSILETAGADASESERLLLVKAAEAFDRSETARRRIERDGIVIEDRFGQKRPHPAVKIEQDSRSAFARICAQLGLDGVDVKPDSYRGGNGRTYKNRSR